MLQQSFSGSVIGINLKVLSRRVRDDRIFSLKQLRGKVHRRIL